VPFPIPATTAGGNASKSTFRPTDKAVAGSTAAAITSCMRRVSVHSDSSPNVSYRNICFPSATIAASSFATGPAPPPHATNAAAAIVVAGKAKDLKEGVAVATKSLDSSEAEGRLDRLIRISNS